MNFKSSVVEKLLKLFQFSKVERKKFKYLGCEVEKLNNGDITLNQNDYIEKIKEVEIPSRRNSHKVNETERKIIRRVVGELLWVSLMTRPALSLLMFMRKLANMQALGPAIPTVFVEIHIRIRVLNQRISHELYTPRYCLFLLNSLYIQLKNKD